MANPQPHEFTKISNELLEALCKKRIPGEARQVLDVILRQTYGYNKKMDAISLTQFSEFTGLLSQNCSRGIKKLSEMRIIVVNKERRITRYSIQKDYEKWIDSIETDSIKNDKKIINTDTVSNQKRLEIPIGTDSNKRKKEIFKEILKEKEVVLANMMKPYLEKYDRDLLLTFYNYWTEKHKSGKKLRYEDQKYFEVGKRLGTFLKNRNARERKYGKQKSQLSEEQRIKLKAARDALFEDDN